jgi:hypothetical protein
VNEVEDPIYAAILGHLSALQSKVNGLKHQYRHSDHLEEKIDEVVEKMAQVRFDVERLIKIKSDGETWHTI